MTLPAAVVQVLAREVVVGEPAQAFPFLTVDTDGYPHVALLSAIEVSAAPDGSVHAAVASVVTRSNLERHGLAALTAVEGTTAHTMKLRVRRTITASGLLGAVLDVVDHKADSLGLELSPITYTPTKELAELEGWDRSRSVLQLLIGL
jgi:hypothetical protein